MIIGRRSNPGPIGPDFTPMIDVVFLLLIFFLVTAQMAREPRVELALPAEVGDHHEDPRSAGLVVSVGADGQLFVGDKQVDIATLRALSKGASERDDSASPIIRADQGAPASLLNEVVEVLRDTGFANFKLATSPGVGAGS